MLNAHAIASKPHLNSETFHPKRPMAWQLRAFTERGSGAVAERTEMTAGKKPETSGADSGRDCAGQGLAC